MSRTRYLVIVAVAALTLSAVGAGVAMAAGGPPRGAGQGLGLHQGKGQGPARGGGAILQAAASYVGMSAADLRVELRGGKSLAQVATAKGKSVDGLKTALVAAAKTRLDQAVAGGRLTADQAKTRLSLFSSRLDTLVNRTGHGACSLAP